MPIQGSLLYRGRRSEREITEQRGIQLPKHQLHSDSPPISAAVTGTTSSEGRLGPGCSEVPQPEVTPPFLEPELRGYPAVSQL